MDNVPDLALVARRLRSRVLRMISRAGSSHVGSCFSIVELLTVLYWDVLRVRPEDPRWSGRDRFILSKGHACAVLYAALAERGFFPLDWLDTTHAGVPGVEASTGSLGHGLPIGAGMALAARREGQGHRIFVLLSDGECDEGTVWESALLASHHRLDNLIAIVDYNRIQSLGAVDDVIRLEPLADKWRSFGWDVREVAGHDLSEIAGALHAAPAPGKPGCVIAHTTKGKGVSFMENTLLWHYRTPRGEELDAALREIEQGLP
jgi:transketolase